MAKIACSSMEAAMEQDGDSEGVEALQHGLHQVLLFLVFLQATTLHGALLFHADNTCRLVPNHAPRMFRRLASSPFASLFCRGTKRPLAAPSAALEAAMKVAPREDLSLRSTIMPVLISYANLKTSAPLCYHFRPYDVRCAAWSEAGHFVAFAVQEPDSTAEGMIERLPPSFAATGCRVGEGRQEDGCAPDAPGPMGFLRGPLRSWLSSPLPGLHLCYSDAGIVDEELISPDPDLRRHACHRQHRLQVGPASCIVGPASAACTACTSPCAEAAGPPRHAAAPHPATEDPCGWQLVSPGGLDVGLFSCGVGSPLWCWRTCSAPSWTSWQVQLHLLSALDTCPPPLGPVFPSGDDQAMQPLVLAISTPTRQLLL